MLPGIRQLLGPLSLARVAQADLLADRVQRRHDRDRLLRREGVARDPALAGQPFSLSRLELHAPALDERTGLLDQRAVRVVDAQAGCGVPDAVDFDAALR